MLALLDIKTFLDALPSAATSPYAFAAYIVLLAAWVVTIWLRGQPHRKSLEIVKTFPNDHERNTALARLLGEAPPDHLPKQQILEWVKIRSAERGRVYLLIGIVAVLVTVIVIVVVAIQASHPATPVPSSSIHIRGGPGGVDCLALPPGARVIVAAEGVAPDRVSIDGCGAKIDWPIGWNPGQLASLTIEGAGGFVLDQPDAKYTVGNPQWDVDMHAPATAPRLVVQVFNYPGNGEQFDEFYQILSSKIRLLGDVIARDHPDCQYLRDLRAEKAGHDEAGSLNQTLTEWQSSNALLFLSGMFYKDGPAEFVRSLPFFGELAPKAGELDGLKLDLGIGPNELGQTTDSHSLAVLYALAMDAKRLGRPNDVVLTFLAQAVSVARSIDSHSPGVDALKDQLRKAFRDIGAPVPVQL